MNESKQWKNAFLSTPHLTQQMASIEYRHTVTYHVENPEWHFPKIVSRCLRYSFCTISYNSDKYSFNKILHELFLK